MASFVWWSAFDAQAPDVFARACTLAAFSGLARVGTIVAADSVRLETKHNAEIAEQRFDLTSETSASGPSRRLLLAAGPRGGSTDRDGTVIVARSPDDKQRQHCNEECHA